MTAFRFPGGSSLVRSSASAASRAATSRSPFFAWNNSLVMSSAAKIAALCVSTMGPCDNTFFSAWSTYAATSRVYSGGKSERTVYSSPPIITLTACFLVLTHAPPVLPGLGALPVPPPLPPGWRACSSRNVRRDSKSCTRPRAASTRWRNVLFSCSRSATRFRISGSGFGATPATPVAPVPAPRIPLSFSSDSALRARARQPASSSATWRRTVSSCSSIRPSTLTPSYAKRVLPRRQRPPRMRGQRPMPRHLGRGHQQPDLEPEERRRPDGRVGLERARPPYHRSTGLHRLPATRCRLHGARRGRDPYR